MKNKNLLHIGVVGATGLVGSMMRDILYERKYPLETIRLFASEKSAGTKVNFGNKQVEVENAFTADYSGLGVVLMSAGGGVSKELAPKIVEQGAIVIDNSSAWRKDTDVPLVVSEVNPHVLDNFEKGIIANPNCTTMVAMPVLKPLHKKAHLKKLIISTYQAVSGAGKKGIDDLHNQVVKHAQTSDTFASKGDLDQDEEKVFARPIGFNVVPLAGTLVEDGSGETDEDQKLRHESQKILEIPDLQVSALCVRVPVYSGHSLSIYATFEHEIYPKDAKDILSQASGVVLDDIPTPRQAVGGNDSIVGRIHQGIQKNELNFFLVGDNLRKGAALNAVQIAELLLHQ